MIDYIEAHRFSSTNRELLRNDKTCGCFYCLKRFDPKEIVDWIGDASGTAICPYCGVDSIIGEHSGYPITEDFLRRMRQYWFSSSLSE